MVKWSEILVVEVAKGRYDVRRGHAVLLAGADEVYAMQYAKRQRTPDEKVTQVALDGYRTDLTKQMGRIR